MPPRPSVNVIGYLHSERAAGSLAREIVAALDSQGVPVRPLALRDPAAADGRPYAAADGLDNPFPINLLCVDPDAVPAVAARLGAAFFAGRHTIGWWAGAPPAAWADGLGCLDEVWTASPATADGLAAVAAVPVAVVATGDRFAAGAAMLDLLTAAMDAPGRAVPATAAAAAARADARALVRRGPSRSARGRTSPQRLLRGLALLLARPAIAYVQQTDAALAAALEETARAGRVARAEDEAAVLRATRRLEERQRALDEEVRALRDFAGRAEPALAAARALEDAAHAAPFMEGEPFALRDEPGLGRVLAYRDAAGSDRGGAYRAFEDVFRGSEAMIRERQRVYLDVLAGHAPVLDAGCGRGEMLDLLREAGVEAAGVDMDADLVAHCRATGHARVECADAVAWLEAAEPASLGAVFSAQVVEHLPHEVLDRFLAAARRALRPGGVLVAETVNPHSPWALKAFWVDLTHTSPIFPEVLLQHCRAAGFPRAFAFAPNGGGDWEDDRRRAGEYAVVATAE